LIVIEVTDVSCQEQARDLIGAYLVQMAHEPIYNVEADRCEAGRQLLAAPPNVQMWAVVDSVRRTVTSGHDGAGFYLRALRTALTRRKLPFIEEAVNAIIDALLSRRQLYQVDVAITSLVTLFEKFAGEHGISDALCERLERLAPHLAENHYSEFRKAADRLGKLLASDDASVSMLSLITGEAWVETIKAALDACGTAARGHWTALLLHCNTANSSKPSQKWLKQAQAFLAPIGTKAFADLAASVLAQIGKPAPIPPRRISGMGDQTDPTLIHEEHSDLLRGLVWCTGLVEDEDLIAAVGAAASACFQKIASIGPRSPKIGNACLFALSQQTNLKAVGELSRLKTRVKHASAKKQLGKSLDAAADRAGMSAEELEEVAVPTCGLTGIGELVKEIGDVTARLAIDDRGDVELTWQPAGKKPQASVPASIKETFAAEVKAIKKSAKEIEKVFAAQRARLERLFLRHGGWTLAEFRTRYLDHPLVGVLARRLIWRFERGGQTTDGMWCDGNIVDLAGRPIAPLDEHSNCLRGGGRVTIWHPSFVRAAEVLAWRNLLESREIRQPFKQAHREIYLLTDAERTTETYSNRFAAHILRQHQFAALCQQRGWTYRLEGAFDSANTPTLELPQWGLRVEFWTESVENPTSEMGIFLYISTDQVRFFRTGEAVPLRLDEVPPLVFSEVMRDVDLFVGVCSVGNDPNWGDGGPDGRYQDYWQTYAFGDLSASGRTRREVLERLLPRLAIADRCTLADRFLVVRGDCRTYKIHLGSGNILMEPNDQYLCIVPQRGGAAAGVRDLFLPFEGDGVLSIILSKAFLLAADTKIADPTILRQIRQ
jgi:hypothetical protein